MTKLSTAANAFAVLGLADVVFRLGTEAFDLFNRCRSAPRNVSDLLGDLQGLANILARVRAFADEYTKSPFVQEDSQVFPPELHTILNDCKRELEELKKLANSATCNSSNGWLMQWSKGLVWALDDQNIFRHRQQLERYKTALGAALSLMGRQNDIIVRQQLQATRKDIADVRACAATGTEKIYQHITSYSSTTQRQLQNIELAVDLSARDNSSSLDHLNHLLSAGNAKIHEVAHSVDNQAHFSRKSVHCLNKELARSRKQQSRLATRQNSSTLRILSSIEDAHLSLENRIATINLTSTESSDMVFSGENLGAITLPLILMHSELTQAIKSLCSQGKMKVFQSEACWILQEFRTLLALSHDSAARDARERATEDHISTANAAKRRTLSNPSIDDHCRRRKNSPNFSNRRGILQRNHEFTTGLHQRHQFDTAAGLLVVDTSILGNDSRTPGQISRSFTCWLSFLPRPELSSVSCSASFSKRLSISNFKPQISRVVQTHNIIPKDSAAIRYVKENRVRDLQKLFEDREASPYDCDEGGSSLLQWAASRWSAEAYEFLTREGATTYAFRPNSRCGWGHLIGIWANMKDHANLYSLEAPRRITALAVEQDCDPNLLTLSYHENLLHCLVDEHYMLSNSGIILSRSQFSELCTFFISLGCELEGRDSSSNTPLLLACEQGQYEMVHILLELGADPNLVDTMGRNALHLLLSRITALKDSEEEAFRDGLIAVLNKSFTFNYLYGPFAMSPSDCAINHDGIWRQWMAAIDHVGYKLLEVAEIEDRIGETTWIVVCRQGLGRQDPYRFANVSEWRQVRQMTCWATLLRLCETVTIWKDEQNANEAAEVFNKVVEATKFLSQFQKYQSVCQG